MNELHDIVSSLGLAAEGRWFRGGLSHGIELRDGKPAVDREQGIIYGYSVITKGPALGHDMEIDDQTLEQVVSLGNKVAPGIKSRFDHPNASNTSMGTFLGRTKNFRRAGDRVLGDLYLSESAKEAPQGDLYSYVLGLAQRDPAAFGASIVFSGKAEPQLNADGTQKRDEKGNPLPRLARIEQLLASDVVDDPAANPNGLFDRGDSLASKITAFLNRWAAHYLLPQLRAQHKEDSMEETQVIATLSHADLDQAKADAVKDERARVTGILAAALLGQHEFAKQLIDLGASVEESIRAFKIHKLTELQRVAPESAGGGAETTTTKVDVSKLPLEERCKAEWECNENGVREEFATLGSYLAYSRADANGQVKILKK